MEDFKSLGIKSAFIKGLTELGIVNPTDIQIQVIPLLLNGNTDLVGQAQTGTGKTAAFGLPLLHKNISGRFSSLTRLGICLIFFVYLSISF